MSKRIAVYVCASAIAVLGLGFAPSVVAQEPQPPQPAPSAPASVEGDLVRVDTDAKLIVVKVEDAETEFVYTDATEISGSQDDAAGLATLKDARVTVHFTEDAETKAKTATRVVIMPAQ